MKSSDNKFFELYKELDRLCSARLSKPNGVSAYIAEMETRDTAGDRAVPGWRSDYKMLKHVRWVRNKIAHESGEGPVSEWDDLVFVESFIERLRAGKDPLSILLARKAKRPPQKSKQPLQRNKRPSQKSAKKGVLVFFLLILLVAVVFIIIKRIS